MMILNDAYHRIGVAFSTIGSILLLTCFAQKVWAVIFFARLPVLPGIAFVVCGAALILVAKTGGE